MAVVKPIFCDTTVLLGGLIEIGPGAAAAQAVLAAIADGRVRRPATAWHCCLEFLSVSTRLPPEVRLAPGDATRLLREEIMQRFDVVDLPPSDRTRLVDDAAADRIGGGRVYDLHIAHVARACGVELVVTDNRRHFASLLRYGIRVLATAEYTHEAGLTP